jgi:hypothetical protein
MEPTNSQFPMSNVKTISYDHMNEKTAKAEKYRNMNVKGIKLDAEGHTDEQRAEYAKQDAAKVNLHNFRNKPEVVKINSAK